MQIISSVQKAMEVLKIFSIDTPELSLTEISERMNLHKSSIFRILNTLVLSGLVEKDPVTNRYRLGLLLLDLANQVLNRYDLRDRTGPYLEALAQETGEIIHLSILDGVDIVYLEKKGQGQPLTVATRVGGRYPAYASAMGKVLLSALPPQDLSDVLKACPLKKLTPTTITEVPELLKALERVKAQGFALDNEESFPGVCCVAAPLHERNGQVVAAISATVPKQRMGKRRMEQLRKLVVETAGLISEHGLGVDIGA